MTIADVTGAFLKVDMDNFVVIKLQGHAVEALLDTNREKYEKYIVNTKSDKIIYIKFLKAMYGTLKALLLWYTLFADTLKDESFTVNPYNNCIANKIINGHQFTICWYVDDIKLSHKDESEIKKDKEN